MFPQHQKTSLLAATLIGFGLTPLTCGFSLAALTPFRQAVAIHQQTGDSRLQYVEGKSTELLPTAQLPRNSNTGNRQTPSNNRQQSASVSAIESGMLNAHNQWRRRYGVPPLRWSPKLAAYAQDWANQLASRGFKLQHRSNSPYGENLAYAGGQQMKPAQVVDMWGNEVKNYNYATNSCRGVCGHYTQVVWKNSTEVGCAVARSSNKEVWVCNYNPPGNYQGEKPY